MSSPGGQAATHHPSRNPYVWKLCGQMLVMYVELRPRLHFLRVATRYVP